jgi:hypothetical protein
MRRRVGGLIAERKPGETPRAVSTSWATYVTPSIKSAMLVKIVAWAWGLCGPGGWLNTYAINILEECLVAISMRGYSAYT